MKKKNTENILGIFLSIESAPQGLKLGAIEFQGLGAI